MSQAEELLNGMSEEIPVHTHPVPDTDTYFVIDPITRKIENTNPKKHVIMQYDHNSERCTFELPRFIDGHDMLECTSVTVNVDNIEVIEPEGDEVVEPRVNSDAPDMTDLRIHPTDPEKVISSWLISRNSTQLAGILSFHIEYKCVDSNGNVVYEWSTDNYDEYEIRARKKNGEAAVVDHTDLLEQWRTRIFGAGDSVMANIAAEGEAQVAAVKAESEIQQEAVELKGAQTLDSIPEDYTEVDVMVDEAVRSKGDAIVCETAGESIVLKDSSNDHIRGLKLFGKSKQATTTGKNLLNNELYSMIKNGLTITVHSDKSFTVDGTATDGVFLTLHTDFNPGAGEYILSGCPSGGGTDKYIIYVTDTESGFYAQDVGRTYKFNHPGDILPDVRLAVYKDTVLNNVVFKPMIRLASIEDDTYEPYTGGMPSPNPEYPQEIDSISNAVIDVVGKNILPVPYHRTSATKNGATFVAQEDGGICVSGTPTGYADLYLYHDIPIAKNGLITFSITGNYTNVAASIALYDFNGIALVNKSIHEGVQTHQTIDLDQYPTATKWHILIKRATDNVELSGTVYPQIEFGNTATDYEPYKSVQSVAIPRTLPGIPVTSGGNYTDSDGHQWICDEIDLERGVYVQRIATEQATIENIKSVDNTYTDLGGTTVYYDPVFAHPANDNVQLVVCDKLLGMSCNDRGSYNNLYRCYAPASNVDAIVLRYPKELGEKTLEDAKTDFAGAKLSYALATPIETPLTAEEITAFKALRTNYPNTTILNDAGAWMSVKYNADTKTYVENPKALKLVDSSTGVVYELKIVDGNLTVVPIQ